MTRRSVRSQILTTLNLHLAAVVLFLVFDLVLGTKLIVAWHRGHSDQTAEYTTDVRSYAQLQAQAGRLGSLPAQLTHSRAAAGEFVDARIPASDSGVVTELGRLTARNHVRLSRAAYTPAPAIPGLVELRIDANVTGEYAPIMHFINDVERDKNHAFFIIRSVTLTGQQGGVVNLRMRMITFMRSDTPAPALLQTGGAAAGEVE